MYWWNIGDLKKALCRGPLPSPMAMAYVMAQSLLVVLGAMPLSEVRVGVSLSQWVLWAVFAGLTAGGIYYCYRLNGGPTGVSFMERFIAVAWVVWIRSMPPVIAMALAGGILLGMIVGPRVEALETPFEYLVPVAGMFYLVAIYWRIGAHIRDVGSWVPREEPEAAG